MNTKPACTAVSKTERRVPRVLLLDLCGVLYDDSCWRRWLLQLLRRMGLQTHYVAFFEVWEQEHLEHVCAGRIGYWDAMREFLREAGLSWGQVDEACAAGQARRRMWEEAIRPLPGVRSTLVQLAAMDVPLAVLSHSSFDQSHVQQRLQRLGLASVLPDLLASSQLGPHYARRFEMGAKMLGVPTSQVAYVGRYRLPLEQSAAAGMQTVAFNTDWENSSYAMVERFADLLQMVARTARRSLAG